MRTRRQGWRLGRCIDEIATAAAGRRATCGPPHPPRPTLPATRSTARRGDPVQSRQGSKCEHWRLPPKNLRSRNRCDPHRLDLDVGARLVSVDLQEDLADAHGRTLLVGNDYLDVLHLVIVVGGRRRPVRFRASRSAFRGDPVIGQLRQPCSLLLPPARGAKTHPPDRGVISATEGYAFRAASSCEIIRRIPARREAGHPVGER
jgi:hypothetical protein